MGAQTWKAPHMTTPQADTFWGPKGVFGKAPARPLHVIAQEIARDWAKPYFGAVPYLNAMRSLDKISDAYGADSAKSVVLYFLSNATTWRGETAKRVKGELRAMAGVSK